MEMAIGVEIVAALHLTFTSIFLHFIAINDLWWYLTIAPFLITNRHIRLHGKLRKVVELYNALLEMKIE